MTPKDYICFIDNNGKTCAVIDDHSIRKDMEDMLHAEGNLIIGYVSSGSQQEAIIYADQVLRKD